MLIALLWRRKVIFLLLEQWKRKREIRKKNEVAEIPCGSLEGLGPTFLAYLDPSDENQGLVLREMKSRIMAVQCRWWEWSCSLTTEQEQNATLLPGRHTPEADFVASRKYKRDIMALMSFRKGEHFVHGQPQADPGKAVGGQRTKLRTQALPTIWWNWHLQEPWLQTRPNVRSHSANIPQTWHHYCSHPMLVSWEPTLLNWTLQINKILYQTAEHWWMLVSPNNKAQLLEFSELFFFSPYPACKQHKLVIKKIQLSESFMMVWAREKFADQRL